MGRLPKMLSSTVEQRKTFSITIRPNTWGSPFFFIKKKDGSLRPVQDYRAVNSWTKRDVYPMPRIEQILEQLHGKVLFTTLDIRDVRLKLAFCTTCAVRILVLAQGPSFLRLRGALLRRRGDSQDKRSVTITSGGVETIQRSCSTSTEETEVVW